MKVGERKDGDELGGGLLLELNTAERGNAFRSLFTPDGKSGREEPEGGHLLEPNGADTGGV